MSFNPGVIKGKDTSGNSKEIGVGGEKNDSLKVVDENTRLLNEILLELKIANAHNCIATDRDIDADSFD